MTSLPCWSVLDIIVGQLVLQVHLGLQASQGHRVRWGPQEEPHRAVEALATDWKISRSTYRTQASEEPLVPQAHLDLRDPQETPGGQGDMERGNPGSTSVLSLRTTCEVVKGNATFLAAQGPQVLRGLPVLRGLKATAASLDTSTTMAVTAHVARME